MPYSVMSEEKTPNFLLGQFRLPGAQDDSRPPLMRLKLIEHEFRLPALVVRRSQFDGRDIIRTRDIGHQGYNLVAVSPVCDLVIDGPRVESGQVGYLHQPAVKPV